MSRLPDDVGPPEWDGEDGAAGAAYRLVDEALREDPGFALPPDFAERVAARAMGGEERSGWFERAVLPALVACMALVALRAGGDPLLAGLGAVRRAVLDAAGMAPRLPAGIVLSVGAAFLAVAAVDRAVAARRRAAG